MEREEIIKNILMSENIKNAVIMYNRYSEKLENCKFIFFSDDYGQELPCYMTNEKLTGIKVNSLVASKKMFVIDKYTCEQMLSKGKANYMSDLCIAFDTQFVSYLTEFFNAKSLKGKNEYDDIIDYVIKNDINYDVSLYLQENARKLNSEKEIAAVYLNLLAIEKFKCIDREEYIKNGKLKFKKEEGEMYLLADDTLNFMKKMVTSKIDVVGDMYCFIKALLLKVAIIEFKYSKKGIKNKATILIEFINNEFGVLMTREIVICYLFLKHDKQVEKFFKKIKPNCHDIIKHINGMAWDLTHLRYLEKIMAILSSENYSLYSIVTFDYGLREVLRAYPIKCAVIEEGNFMPVFEKEIYEIIKEIDNLEIILQDNINTRARVKSKIDIEKLIKNLEIELGKLIK